MVFKPERIGMFLEFLKKQVSLKIAFFSSGLLAFVAILFTLLVAYMEPSIAQGHAVGFFVLFSLFFICLQTTLVIISSNLFIGRPLNKLMHSMQRVKEGRLDERCPVASDDEIGELSEGFNDMVQGLGQVNESRKQIQQRLIKAEENLKYKLELEAKARIIERMNSELTGAFNDVSLLYTVSQYLNSILEFEELVSKVQKIFNEKFYCDAFGFYLFSSVDQKLKLVAHKKLKQGDALLGKSLVMESGSVSQKTIKRKRSFYINDLTLNTGIQLAAVEEGLRGAVFSVPLIVRDEIIGLLTVCRKNKNSFSPTDRQSLDSIASQMAVAYDRSELYTQTKEMSVRDELTGVYNRRHFHQVLRHEIKRAERFDRDVSLLMIDMDHFKTFNDTYGHLKGDEILKCLTKLLEENVREVDLIARFGGEEFVIILPSTSLKDAIQVANKLRKIVRSQLKRLMKDGEQLRIGQHNDLTVSIGVSSYPAVAMTPKDLINTADMALYRAKKDGRDLVRHYADPVVMKDMLA